MERILENAEVELLHNRSSGCHACGTQPITLVGVGDLWSDEIEPRRAFAGVRGENPTMLLAHNPTARTCCAIAPGT